MRDALTQLHTYGGPTRRPQDPPGSKKQPERVRVRVDALDQVPGVDHQRAEPARPTAVLDGLRLGAEELAEHARADQHESRDPRQRGGPNPVRPTPKVGDDGSVDRNTRRGGST